MISRALVDYDDTGKAIGCILDEVYTPSVSMNNSIGFITSFSYTALVVHCPKSNDHLQIRNLINGNMLSSPLKTTTEWKSFIEQWYPKS